MSPAAQSLVALRSCSFFRAPPENGCAAPPPARLACSRRSATGFTGLTANGRKIHGINIGEDHDQSAFKMGGRFVEGWFVYRQTFVIRSYEIGPDKTATMETLMNLLQANISPPSSSRFTGWISLGWFLLNFLLPWTGDGFEPCYELWLGR